MENDDEAASGRAAGMTDGPPRGIDPGNPPRIGTGSAHFAWVSKRSVR
jgi:hypothetical protein